MVLGHLVLVVDRREGWVASEAALARRVVRRWPEEDEVGRRSQSQIDLDQEHLLVLLCRLKASLDLVS